MSNPNPGNLHSRLARIRRRWVMLRLLEHAGMGLLIGCGLSMPLTAMLLWQGEPAWRLMMGISCLSLLIGALAGWLRRPGVLDAAVETDRQLRLSDLLSTALLLERLPPSSSTDGPFRDTILQLARHRCQTIAENELVLRRLGARAWSGIGLMVLLSFALAMLAGNPLVVRAGKVRAADGGSSESFSHSASPRWVARENLATTERDPEARPGQSGSKQADGSHPDRGGSVAGTFASDSTGDQAARSGEAMLDRATSGIQNGTEPRQRGIPSAGSGASASASTAGENVAESTAARRLTPRTAPWELDGWDHARSQALRDADTPNLPAAYRDLVRDYFAR